MRTFIVRKGRIQSFHPEVSLNGRVKIMFIVLEMHRLFILNLKHLFYPEHQKANLTLNSWPPDQSSPGEEPVQVKPLMTILCDY